MLNRDYREMLSAFCEQRVEFLLVGGYALAVHGVVRATGDMDLWIRPTPGNARRVWLALEDFGAPLHDLTGEDLATANLVFQIGVVPRRIDIMTGIDGVAFDTAWEARVEVTIDGVRIPVLGRADLIRNKRASGRPEDVADVARLERCGI